MDLKYNHEKILIIVALILCAGILFYNAFFIPNISIPSVIYLDSDTTSKNSINNNVSTDKSYIESDTQQIETNPEAKEKSTSNSSTGKININTATETELVENLNGIGSVTAKKIIAYREKVGKFKTIDEIKNISGIGEKIFEKFKNMICV